MLCWSCLIWVYCMLYETQQLLLCCFGVVSSSARAELRGLDINELLFLQDNGISSVFSYGHRLFPWCPFNHIWTVGIHIQMCSFIDSTQDLIWDSPPLGGVRGSASLFPQGLSAFLLDQPGLSTGLSWHHLLWFEPSHIFLWIATDCTYHTAILTHMKLLSQPESLHAHYFEEIPQTCWSEAYQWHFECRPGDIWHWCYRLDESCRKNGIVVSCSC